MNVSRQIRVACAGAALALVGVLGVAAPANAAPSNCNSFVATDGRGYAKCTSGTGEYRVGIACKGWIRLGYGFTEWGNWARPGGVYQSVAKCPIGSWNWSPSGGNTYYAFLEKRG